MTLIRLPEGTLDVDASLLELDRMDAEESLYAFLRAGWKYIDPAPYTDGWVIEAVAEHLQAVCDGEIRRLIVNIPPRCSKSSLISVAFPAWVWAQRYDSPTSGPGVPFLHASYDMRLSLRDSVKCRRLIESPWYQRLWGERVKFSADQNQKTRFQNTAGGERLITSIGSGVTGEGGNVIIIDDPNAANEAFSEASIQSTIDWWDGSMSTRHNDPKTGAFVVVQQRLAEDDLTGHILSKSRGEWTHLVLPMRYEADRSFVTNIGWQDPRTEEGELLWPERFGEEEVNNLSHSLGPFACNPAEAPILMADLTMCPIGDIQVGDEIIGFDKRETVGEASHGRHKLTRATVLEVHKRTAPVVQITLEHGDVIRCTPDHKWYTKDRGPNREMYLPATLRSRLARVCPANLPILTDPEDIRDAGWLSGFFDGEGSVSACMRGGYDPSSIISFYQGAGRNLPLCEKLERLLTKFGFEYTYSEDERKPNKDAPCYGYRSYRVKSDGVRVVQKFISIIQPTKWRDRLIDGVFRSNFIQQREKVLSIEPDGEDVVYALTTTTGNYIVWGLASSNSAGQLQQRPEVKGGGVIPRDTWQLWEADAYPPMDYIIASLDTAYTLKQENDYSALTVWGVFSGDTMAQATNVVGITGRAMAVERTYAEGSPKAMLMSAWQERLELHNLTQKVADTCKRMKVDKLLIENKAAGISVAQEIRRLFGSDAWAVQLVDPKAQDKLARLYSVQHLFFEGMIYAPDRSWADMVITQTAGFPKMKHDDLTDTLSQGLQHLRTIGLLTRAPERLAELDDARQHRGGDPAPLYPA